MVAGRSKDRDLQVGTKSARRRLISRVAQQQQQTPTLRVKHLLVGSYILGDVLFGDTRLTSKHSEANEAKLSRAAAPPNMATPFILLLTATVYPF